MERRRHYNRNPEASPLAPRRNALHRSRCCSLSCDLNHACKTWHCCKCCSCQHGANAGRGEWQGELLRPGESRTKNPSLKTTMTWRQSTRQRWLMMGKWVTTSRLGSKISANQPLSHKRMERHPQPHVLPSHKVPNGKPSSSHSRTRLSAAILRNCIPPHVLPSKCTHRHTPVANTGSQASIPTCFAWSFVPVAHKTASLS